MLARAQPPTDTPGLLPVCFRCGASGGLDPNPRSRSSLEHARAAAGARHGDACAACGTRFVRSFLTFESLPLVEFQLAPGISDKDVSPCCS